MVRSLEDDFVFQLSAAGIPFEREYRAIPSRRYRWDFFIPPDLLVEIQGGIWLRERTAHSTGVGIKRDAEKQNLAALHGYRTMSFVPDHITSGSALAIVEEYLKGNL